MLFKMDFKLKITLFKRMHYF